MITIGTIGLVPQICLRFEVVTFQLFNPANERRTNVRITYENGFVMGWVALIYNLSPDWTWMPQSQQRKESKIWKAAIQEKGEEILELFH